MSSAFQSNKFQIQEKNEKKLNGKNLRENKVDIS